MNNVKIGNINVGTSSPRVVCNVGRLECALNAIEIEAEIIELRCDLVFPHSIDEICNRAEVIRKAIKAPIIGTIRKTEDGGNWYLFDKTDEERYPIFERIIPFIDAVDIEYNSRIRDSIVKLCRSNKRKIILSMHNFGYTPTKKDISELINKMDNIECDILKIACMVGDMDDFKTLSETLIEYVEDKSKTKPISVIPMGHQGRPGRYMFPWFGSCFTYGCITEAKAPSQPFVQDLVNAIKHGKTAIETLDKSSPEFYRILCDLEKAI